MNQMIVVKSLILLIITTINMPIVFIYILFFNVWVCVYVCTSVRVSLYITTFVAFP